MSRPHEGLAIHRHRAEYFFQGLSINVYSDKHSSPCSSSLCVWMSCPLRGQAIHRLSVDHHLYSWDGKFPHFSVMVTVSIITPMSKRLHCCYRVLFVMFLAPSFATDISILFTSDCPYYMSKSFIMMCPCLDCKCHLHVYKNGWMQYLS